MAAIELAEDFADDTADNVLMLSALYSLDSSGYEFVAASDRDMYAELHELIRLSCRNQAGRVPEPFSTRGPLATEAASVIRDVVCNPFRPFPPYGAMLTYCRDLNPHKVECRSCLKDVEAQCVSVGGANVYLCPECKAGQSAVDARKAVMAWMAWNYGAIRKMAEVAYRLRDFRDLPIMADALEEAGCCQPAILGHCRARRIHSRGCWAVDLLRGLPVIDDYPWLHRSDRTSEA